MIRKRGRPATGHTPKRYFRMSNDDWALVVKAAKRDGVSRSDFIREALLKKSRQSVRKRREGESEPLAIANPSSDS
jgi:uncharacterized protein (DUF1778 family)